MSNAALPEPATLTRTSAEELVREIRADLRPRLLDALRESYRADGADVMARAEIFAGEFRLRKLDTYLLSLLPVLRDEANPFGWEGFAPQLLAITQVGDGVLQADVDLAFTPENNECIHGPCTIVPAATLAQRLCADDERLTVVERVTWAVPLRHRLRLRVWDSASHADAEKATAETAVFGRFRTSRGRTLEFAGVPLHEHPLLLQRDYNGLSQQLIAGTSLTSTPDTTSVDFTDAGLATCRRALHDQPAQAAALLLDMVPIAILNWRRGRSMVCGGFRDVPLAASPDEAFAAGTRLDVRYRADRSHVSARSGLWIAYYEFRYLPRQSDWSTIVMAEADSLETLLRHLHS